MSVAGAGAGGVAERFHRSRSTDRCRCTRLLGFADGAITTLRRAALVHEFGTTAVPNSIWDKPGPLTRAEFDRVELHPMLTEQMLRRSAALAALNPVAAAHHEKADGSGYHKRLRADAADPGAGVLAAADIYVGLTTDRADRPAFSGKFAATELRRLASQGVLEQDTIDAVLMAAGRTHHERDRRPALHLIKDRRPPHPARLHQDRGIDPSRRRPVGDAKCRRPLSPWPDRESACPAPLSGTDSDIGQSTGQWRLPWGDATVRSA